MTNDKIQNVYNSLVDYIIEGGDWQNNDTWWRGFDIILTNTLDEAGDNCGDDEEFVEQVGNYLVGQILSKAQEYGAQLA